MNLISYLQKEHEEIRNRILKLENFMGKESFELGEISEEFHSLVNFWNIHEERENKLFALLKKMNIPVEKMLFEHKELRGHKKIIENALSSQDKKTIQICLDTDGKMLIEKLRKHMEEEDEFLGRILFISKQITSDHFEIE